MEVFINIDEFGYLINLFNDFYEKPIYNLDYFKKDIVNFKIPD